eukprot:193640_1
MKKSVQTLLRSKPLNFRNGQHLRPFSVDAMRQNTRTAIQSIRDAGTYKNERVITSPQKAEITVEGSSNFVLSFCANNYLGLSDHPLLIEAAKKALDTHGLGLSSVRFICGTQDIHKELERKISEFHGTEDAILYASCFDANAGIFESLLTKDDAIISDQLNHASIIDGVRLCKAKRHRYRHADMDDLEQKLKEAQDSRFRMIATDGVFSMDGSIAPLDKICDLAEKYDAEVFIDECHATGFFGATGRGTPEYHSVTGRIGLINSTLGKALGGATGGYTTGRREYIELLRQKSRPYLFSNAVAPPVVGAAIKTFDMLTESSELVEKLCGLTICFREKMSAAGFTLRGAREHPIVPVMLGDAKLASDFADAMLKEGIYVIGFSYPVVPMGEARIRVQISACHSEEQVDKCANAFMKVGKSLGVI